MQMRRLWLPALRAVKGHWAQGVWHNSSSEMPPLGCPPPQFKYPLQWGALQGLARPFPSPFSGPFSVLQPLPLLKPGAEPSTDALWVCTQLGPHSSNSGPWGDLERKSSELPMLAATRGKSRDRAGALSMEQLDNGKTNSRPRSAQQHQHGTSTWQRGPPGWPRTPALCSHTSMESWLSKGFLGAQPWGAQSHSAGRVGRTLSDSCGLPSPTTLGSGEGHVGGWGPQQVIRTMPLLTESSAQPRGSADPSRHLCHRALGQRQCLSHSVEEKTEAQRG